MKKLSLFYLLILFPSLSMGNQDLLAKLFNNKKVKIGLALAKVSAGLITTTSAAIVTAQVLHNHHHRSQGGVDKFPLRLQMVLYGSVVYTGMLCTIQGIIELAHR